MRGGEGLTYAQVQAYVESLTDVERAELAAELDAEDADRRAHPLAWAKLWHREEPRTSQRTAAKVMLGARQLYRFLLGGNRSSKTWLGTCLDVVYALGSDHPDVIRWARLNEIDLAATDVRRGGVDVWSVALDFGDSRRYVRPYLASLFPAGTKLRNWNGEGEAEALLPNGRKITCKAVKQGRDGFQGDAVGRVHFDEEPRDPGVVAEAKMRIVDLHGHIAYTMTPLYGWTPLLSEHVRDPDAADTVVRWLHGTDNPHVPRALLERILSSFGTHERAARERGDIVAMEGRIYTDWRRDLHVVPAFAPPDTWPRYAWVDFGTRNPTAIGWVAQDQRDDVLHVYRESYRNLQTTEWQAQRFKVLSRWEDEDGVKLLHGEKIRAVVADSAAADERDTWARLGIPTVGASKAVREGISAVASRLAPDANGKPHIVVHDCCPNVIREFEGYVWRSRIGLADQPDEPLKKDDHHMDGLRYLVMHLTTGGVPVAVVRGATGVRAWG